MQVISWKPEFKFAAKSGFSLIWFAKDAQVVSTKKKTTMGNLDLIAVTCTLLEMGKHGKNTCL